MIRTIIVSRGYQAMGLRSHVAVARPLFPPPQKKNLNHLQKEENNYSPFLLFIDCRIHTQLKHILSRGHTQSG